MLVIDINININTYTMNKFDENVYIQLLFIKPSINIFLPRTIWNTFIKFFINLDVEEIYMSF